MFFICLSDGTPIEVSSGADNWNDQNKGHGKGSEVSDSWGWENCNPHGSYHHAHCSEPFRILFESVVTEEICTCRNRHGLGKCKHEPWKVLSDL